MPESSNVSFKIHGFDHPVISGFAERYESNRLEVITAMRLNFERTSERRRRASIQEARKLAPGRVGRVGRGNHKRVEQPSATSAA
jgi:hypothetical protein